MPDITPNLSLKKPLGTEMVSRTAYNENLDLLDANAAPLASLTAHLAESVQESISATRNASLVGVQTINTVASRVPKSISIVAAVGGTFKVSISAGAGSVYSRTADQFVNAASNVAIADDGTNRTFGVIQNFQSGSFDINWTHTGTGATGTVSMEILVTYHD